MRWRAFAQLRGHGVMNSARDNALFVGRDDQNTRWATANIARVGMLARVNLKAQITQPLNAPLTNGGGVLTNSAADYPAVEAAHHRAQRKT